MRSTNREIVRDAFAEWMSGTGYIAGIFDTDMCWEIAGRSALAGTYRGSKEFVNKVLHPFGARFSESAPFRPVAIRGLYADDEQNAVVVVWDGEGTTLDGTPYRNTYAWVLTLQDGKVCHAIAFFDSIALDEVWAVTPA
jgi:ketosteroid isomerase-like protein